MEVFGKHAWEVSYCEFAASTLIVDVHCNSNGFELGKALEINQQERARQIDSLLAEFGRRRDANPRESLERFKLCLKHAPITGDVVFLSGAAVNGKHIILNTMLTTPTDILRRVYDAEIQRALQDGRNVFVDGSEIDPREALIRRH